MKDLYIIGAGGFGREVLWLAERINDVTPTWNIKGFIDDNEQLWGKEADGYPIFGGCEYLIEQGEVYAVCAVGFSKVRKKIINKFGNSKVKFATLIDPSVIISHRLEIGEGTIICAGSIVMVDLKIGKHVIINLDSKIGHDDIIGDFVTINPSVNVSGAVTIGDCTEIGTGTKIIQGKTIGSDIIIGAGATVIRDCLESGTYVGSPVRKIK